MTALCQQLSQGLSQLTHSGSDDFNFNNQTSINQNTVNLNVTTINNTFNQSVTSVPAPVTPVSLSFSPNLSQSQIPANNSISSTASNLPKPDQWLGQIVNSTSPVLGKMDGTSPRRAPALGVHSRAMSLDSSGAFQRTTDPFDAEWADIAAKTNPTNPFLASSTTPQPFQIQL